MDGIFVEYIEVLGDPFIDPSKRVFFGYLLLAMILGLLVLMVNQRISVKGALWALFSRRIWLSRSAVGDYKMVLINQAMLLGVLPRLISKLALGTIIFEFLHILFNGRIILSIGSAEWVVPIVFTIALFILDDASKYVLHRILHQSPLLWCFHKVHHTAEYLTPLTVYRTHPVEAILFALRSTLVQAMTLAVCLFFFGPSVDLVSVLGANIFLFLFNITGSNLRHSHVWLSYGSFTERIVISPAQHQLHHSYAADHKFCNFGSVLAIWDRMGGTLLIAKGSEKEISFGISEDAKCTHDLKTLYLIPCRDAVHCLVTPLIRGFSKMPKLIVDKSQLRIIFGVLIFFYSLASVSETAFAAELNIYSHRQPFLIKPFISEYEEKTGTKVNIVYASKGLAQRLQAEGKLSPADVILTVDIGRLHIYADKGLLAPIDSSILKKNIPVHLRDPDNQWFAFSKRARVIVVSNRTGPHNSIQTYEELSEPSWRGRICLRPGSHVYNRALVASFISAIGPDATETWAKGLIANLARRPQGNDRAQVKAIYEGVCDISLINNYYYNKLKYSDKLAQREWSKSVTLIFPNQDDRGTHINISGGGVAKYSKNKAEAVRFLEFMTSSTAQGLFGSTNFEYPVNPGVETPAVLGSWGTFKEDQISIQNIAVLGPKAQRIIDRVGW